jgi:hypothetical protein
MQKENTDSNFNHSNKSHKNVRKTESRKKQSCGKWQNKFWHYSVYEMCRIKKKEIKFMENDA